MNPQSIDFQTPFDPTGYATISGAQLQQMVSGLAPQAYIGWNVVTDDDNAGNPAVPNAITETKWKYYNWVRRTKAGGVLLYVWNPAGATDATLLNWQVANLSSIPSGSITGSQIAQNTITGNNIAAATIPWGCMVNGAAVGGCLTGNLPNPALSNLSVGFANISLGCITGGDPATVSLLADNTIQGRNITQVDANGILDANVKSIAQAGGGLTMTGATGKMKLPAAPAYGQILRVANGAAAWEATLNYFVRDLGDASKIGTAFQLPRTNAAANGIEWANPVFLQQVIDEDASTDTTATTIPYDDTIPQSNEGKEYKQYSITPKLATSKLIFEVTTIVSISVAAGNVALSLFDANNVNYPAGPINALAATAAWVATASGLSIVTFRAQVNVAALTLNAGVATFALRFGAAANSGFINRDSTNGRRFGGTTKVAVKIVEVP